jgi:hypothetical protein
MIATLRRRYARLRGFDIDGGVVPAMDGPLSPNTRLDDAPVLGRFPDLDNLVAVEGSLLGTQRHHLLSLTPERDGWMARDIARFDAPIASLARAPDGALAIGLDGHGIRIHGGPLNGKTFRTLCAQPLSCPTALCFQDPDTLLVANGSAVATAADWKRDLMNLGSSGSLWRLSLASGEARPLAEGLAFPAGIALDNAGAIYVSEAWRHRIFRLGPDGQRREVLDQLPAYPGRIAAGADGFWLALFAPRNQLVEFVLKEPEYRQRMVAQIDPDFWIAPALRSGGAFRAPLQGGGIKKLNALKPWSPSWSYGLVLQCDALMRPIASYHSRAGGAVHGVTSAVSWAGGVMVAARGAGLLVQLDLPQTKGRRQT